MDVPFPAHVNLVEVGPRDGLQAADVVLPVDVRVELIERLAAAGAHRIEAASFVHPRLVPQMAEAEAVVDSVAHLRPAVSLIGLVLNRRGLERALATEIDEVNFVIAAAEGYSRANQGMSVETAAGEIEQMIPMALADDRRVSVTISVAFGDPYDGEVPPAVVLSTAERMVAAGAGEIALGDTIGVAVPTHVDSLVVALREAMPDIALRCHFHDTRRAGLANVAAALGAGVAVFDTSVGGLGGSPFAPSAGGNVGTEDAIVFLERMGIATGYDLEAVVATGRWLGGHVGALPAAMQHADPWPPPAGAAEQGR